MTTASAQVQLSLSWYARWLMVGSVLLAKATGVRVPHRWVVAVTNRSWHMRVDGGPWRRIRIDDRGRISR